MYLSQFFGRRDVHSSHRSRPRSQPMVEGLEGRQLLSTIGLASVETSAVVGSHIGTNATAEGGGGVGQHIG